MQYLSRIEKAKILWVMNDWDLESPASVASCRKNCANPVRDPQNWVRLLALKYLPADQQTLHGSWHRHGADTDGTWGDNYCLETEMFSTLVWLSQRFIHSLIHSTNIQWRLSSQVRKCPGCGLTDTIETRPLPLRVSQCSGGDRHPSSHQWMLSG